MRGSKRLRTWLQRLLVSRGYELRRQYAFPDRTAHSLDLLGQHGWTPQTVIDVGVANGTPWLYSAFPRAKFVLIDPHPAASLAQLRDRLRADIYPIAVGAQAGTLTLHMDVKTPSSSSLLVPSAAMNQVRGERAMSEVAVPVQTLDDTLGKRYTAPYLLKIDAEGFELNVLRGAEQTLEVTDAVVVECSVAQRFEGACDLAEVMAYLHTRGLRLFDIAAVRTFKNRGSVNYVDAVFARTDALYPFKG